MKKQFLVVWILILPLIGLCQNEDLPNVTIRDTEVREISSEFVNGMTYEIHIALPANYLKSNDSYPVVYYLDAYYWGGIVIETYRLLRAFNEIPPLILVGVSYPNASGTDANNYRSRDFTPTHVPTEDIPEWLKPFTPRSGGAESFLSFVENELIPTIESNYRVDASDRGLLGYSYGGLFGAYVLFKKPDLFQKYLLGAPALIFDHYYVLKEEEKLANVTRETPAKVFSAVGSEDIADILKSWIALRDRLNSRKYEKLSFEYMILDGENHTSAIPAVHSRAFRVLYGRK